MLRTTIFPIFIALLMAACTTEPVSPDIPTPVTNLTSQPPAAQASEATTGTITTTPTPSTSALNTQESTATTVSIYFEKDQYAIAAEYQPLLLQQAEFLKQSGKTVTLEGNTDERGSSEYNLALGDRRAQAVRKSLIVLGVAPDLIKVISYGEEKPAQTCHEEKCWHENRRVDFRF